MIVAATNRGVVLVSGDTSEIVLASDVRCLAAGGGLLYAGTEREGVLPPDRLPVLGAARLR